MLSRSLILGGLIAVLFTASYRAVAVPLHTRTCSGDKADGRRAEHDDPATAPSESGEIDPAHWRPLTPDQQAEAVEQLKAMASRAMEQTRHPMRIEESQLFLLYTDVPEIDSARYAALLERAYARLAELFGVEAGHNLYRGKGLVFIFGKPEDYHLFERLAENSDPGASLAMTHCFGDGMVHMAFCRNPDDLLFSHHLAHETVHGFLHRYRTPARVPSWVNEGLADEVASELVPDPRRSAWIAKLAQLGLRRHKNFPGDLFTARHIDGWQYPVAESLTAYMIEVNRQGYLNFVNTIKEGQGFEDSLKANLNLTPAELVNQFRKSLSAKHNAH